MYATQHSHLRSQPKDLRSELPPVFRQYVARIQNVLGDGNCGFRALAVALGQDENMYFDHIRQEMFAEYNTNKQFYDEMFGPTTGAQLYAGLSKSYINEFRPVEYWMMMPDAPILLSNRLGLIINCISVAGNHTVFPFWRGEGELMIDEPISIALINEQSHFVMVKLQGNYPMAPPPPYWVHHRVHPKARRWAQVYKDRLDRFDEYVRSNLGPPIYLDVKSG